MDSYGALQKEAKEPLIESLKGTLKEPLQNPVAERLSPN